MIQSIIRRVTKVFMPNVTIIPGNISNVIKGDVMNGMGGRVSKKIQATKKPSCANLPLGMVAMYSAMSRIKYDVEIKKCNKSRNKY